MRKTISISLILLASIMVFSPVALPFSKPSSVPLEKKIGQMVMIGFHGTNINDKDMAELKQQINNGEVGGVLFLSYNIENKGQTLKLINDLKKLEPHYPLFFAVDQEGGKIERLKEEKGFKHFPSAKEIGLTKTTEEAYSIYLEMANILKETGFNLNFAPVVDLDIDPNSPAIGKLERSFSADPNQVINYAEALIKAHRAMKVLTCLKHYPGHGSAANDSHLGLTDVSDTWQEKELIPYKELIKNNMTDMVMSCHVFNNNVDKNYPASLSEKHLNQVLRRSMNYDGMVITDDLQMSAIDKAYDLESIVITAINSGNDLLLFANYFKFDKELPWKIKKIIIKAIKEGKIKESHIDEAFERIIKLKEKIS